MKRILVLLFLLATSSANGETLLEKIGNEFARMGIPQDTLVRMFVSDGLAAFAHCNGAIYNFKKAAEARELITKEHGEEAMIVSDYVAEQLVIEEGRPAFCKKMRARVDYIGNPFLSFRVEKRK